MPKTHLAYIDSLRGIAILMVIMLHCNSYGILRLTEANGLIFQAIGQGGKGVQLFFILSTLTLIITNKKLLNFSGFSNHFHFFVRRFFRIAPMWYFGIVLYLAIYGMGSRSQNDLNYHLGVFEIIVNAVFLNGFYPNYINSVVPGGWSIGNEMIFYFIFPFLLIKLTNLNRAIFFSLIAIIGIAVITFFIQKFGTNYNQGIWLPYLYYYFPNQLQVFSLGFILYYFIYDVRGSKENSLETSTFYIFLFMVFFELFFGIKIFRTHLLFSAAFAVFIYVMSKWPNILFVNPIFGFIGKVSFSIYIIHFAILHYMEQFGLLEILVNPIQNYLIKFVLATFVSVGLSAITYTLIEKPGQKLGVLLIKK